MRTEQSAWTLQTRNYANFLATGNGFSPICYLSAYGYKTKHEHVMCNVIK